MSTSEKMTLRASVTRALQHPAAPIAAQVVLAVSIVLLKHQRHPAAQVLHKVLLLLSGVLAAPTIVEGIRSEIGGAERLLRQHQKLNPQHREAVSYLLKLLRSMKTSPRLALTTG